MSEQSCIVTVDAGTDDFQDILDECRSESLFGSKLIRVLRSHLLQPGQKFKLVIAALDIREVSVEFVEAPAKVEDAGEEKA